MRNLALIACVFMLMTVEGRATQINLTVSYTGSLVTTTHGTQGDIAKITDGYFPHEQIWSGGDSYPAPDRWNGENNVVFRGNSLSNREIFYFDFGGTYMVEDVRLAVDNNDQYDVEYFTGTGWNNLFTIDRYYGSSGYSMDNFSTISGDDILSDYKQDYDSRIDFTAVETSRLRLYAYNTTWDVNYSIGEFQVFGTVVGGDSVPEPATMFLFGTGLIGLAGFKLRKKKK